MAAFNFPDSPSDGQVYVENNRGWVWSASTNSWKSLNTSGTIPIVRGGTGLSTILTGDAFLSSNLSGTALTYRIFTAGSGILVSVYPSSVVFTNDFASSSVVDNGDIYNIPFYPSAGTLITGSTNFQNVGTGISILYSSSSINTSTGALVVTGGVGIGGSLYVGGRSLISGIALSSGIIIGNLTGIATTSHYSYQSGYAVTSGIATTARNIDLVSAGNVNTSFYIPFSGVITGSGVALSSDSSISYNPSQKILSVSGLAITALTGGTTSAQGALVVAGGVGIGGSVYIGGAGNTGLIFGPFPGGGYAAIWSQNSTPSTSNYTLATNGNAGLLNGLTAAHITIGAQQKLSVDTSSVTIQPTTGSATTGAGAFYVKGTAAFAQTVNIGGKLFLFSSANGTNCVGLLYSGTANTVYNLPSSTPSGTANSILQSTPSGVLTWIANVPGLAITSTNVNVVSSNDADTTLSLVFTPSTTTASGAALSIDSQATYNPLTNQLVVGSLAGNGITIGSSSRTINTSTGNLVLDSVGGTVEINDNLRIFGTLIIDGDTVSIGSTISTLLDPVFVLGAGIGGTNPSIDDNKDRGIEFRYHSGTAKTGFFGWDDSEEKFVFYSDAINTDEIFSGTLGTAKFSNIYSNLFGNVTGYATTSDNIRIVTANSSSLHPITFTKEISQSGSAISADNVFLYDPSNKKLYTSGLLITSGDNSTSENSGALYVKGGLGLTGNAFIGGTVTASLFAGNLTGIAVTAPILTGTATTSTNLHVATGNSNQTHWVLFGAQQNGTGIAVSSGTGLTFNPTTGNLTVQTLIGNVSATAVTSTNFYGTLTGSATTAQNVNIVLDSTSNSNKLLFTPSITSASGAALSIATFASIDPSNSLISLSSGKLAANGITVGSSDSTISTASNDLILTSATENVKINNNLSITGNLTVNGTTTSIGSTITTLLDPVFVLGAGIGGTNPTVDDDKYRGIEFRYFSGSAKTGFFGFDDSTGYFTFIPDGLNTNEVFSGAAGTAKFTTFIGNLIGTATTATNINVSTGSSNQTHWVLFGSSQTGTGIAISSGSGLTFNPSTGNLTVPTLIGNLSATAATSTNFYGTLQGIATTSTNLNVNDSTSNQTHWVLFGAQQNGTGIAVSSGSGLTFNPSTKLFVLDGTLNATLFSGYAETSNSVRIATAAASTPHPVLFTPSANISGSAISANGTFLFNSLDDRLFASGISVTSSVGATSTTGALVVTGGLSVGSNAFIGGTFTITNTTGSASSTTGALVVRGGLGISQDAFIGRNLDVRGTATVRSLTSGRVTFAGTNGLLSDDANFQYSTTTDSLTLDGTNSTNPNLLITKSIADLNVTTPGLRLTNSTIATSGNNLFSPTLEFASGTWGGSAFTARVKFQSNGSTVDGASLNISYSIDKGSVSFSKSFISAFGVTVDNSNGYVSASTNQFRVLPYATGSSSFEGMILGVDVDTLADVSNNYPSPSFVIIGNEWNGTASQNIHSRQYVGAGSSISSPVWYLDLGHGYNIDRLPQSTNYTNVITARRYGPVSITQSIGATSQSYAALTVAGGFGLSGSAFIGGTVFIQNTTNSTTTTSGALRITGGASVGQSLSIGGRLQLFSSADNTKNVSFRYNGAGTTEYLLPPTAPAIGISYLTSSVGGTMAWTPPTPYTKSISILSPTATDNITLFTVNDAATITKLHTVLRGSGTPKATFKVIYGNDRSGAGTTLDGVGTGYTASSTVGGDFFTSFTNSSVGATNVVWLRMMGLSGTVDEFHLTVTYV